MYHRFLNPHRGQIELFGVNVHARLWVPALLVCSLLAGPIASTQAGGTVRAWGSNSDGQRDVPAGLKDVVAVAGGGLHSLALKGDGTVAAWGWNLLGETNVPPGLTNAIAIAANYGYSLALRSDGTVVGWGTASNAVPAGLTNVVALSAGLDHALALRQDGTLVPWGEVIAAPAAVSNVIGLAAGDGHSLALRADGKVVAWGNNASGQTNVPAALANVVAVAAGDHHSLALKSDGTVSAWGDDTYGQRTVPAGLSNVVAIAAGNAHSLALRTDGSIIAWGRDDFGQATSLPFLTGAVGVSGGLYHSLALVGDGSPVITVPPVSQTIVLTKTATFRVMAAGSQPLAYQWYRDGGKVAGATTSRLQIPNVKLTDGGAFHVVVSNLYGMAASLPATLTPVPSPPWISVEPSDATNICGDTVRFTVAADGQPPLSYQWAFENITIPDATNASLSLTSILTSQAGRYSVTVTNPYGSVTSREAVLTVLVEPPQITSPLSARAVQGAPFNYNITALHKPTLFTAVGLPGGLNVNPTNGMIRGDPLESGLFMVTLGAATACATDSQVLSLTVASSAPAVTSPLVAFGTEGTDFTYQITGSGGPTSFGAGNLPAGLRVDPVSGLISGIPVYAGDFDATIAVTNPWASDTALLHFTISNRVVTGLAIADVTYSYSSPYLLDFQFALRDSDDPAVASAVVVNPTNLVVVCKENDKPISQSETAYILAPGAGIKKLVKVNLALDFSESIASLANGDTDADGVSDAVDNLVSGAQDFVNQLAQGSQVGVFEFHRDDLTPQKVIGLTADKAAVNTAIAGIWTNYVGGFPAGSRCWDALMDSIADLGASNIDEQHYVVFVSDGRDESSAATVDDVITAATNANVRIYCVGYGAELDPASLLAITTATAGRYFTATNPADLAAEFGQISKDIGGQYILRWATLKRGTTPFMPSFEVMYGTNLAFSPTNLVWTNFDDPIIDTNDTPATTNYPLVTNYTIGWFTPSERAGDVTIGSLRLVNDAREQANVVTLRATYVPRFIRQLRIRYRANWPCTVSQLSSAPGEILHGWSLSETNDGAGGNWLLLSAPYPQSPTNSIPYGAFGGLLNFTLRDLKGASNAFSLFQVDNTIYTNTGKQSFVVNTNGYVTTYPPLPLGTPVPWLIANGFSGNFIAAETSDPDLDGAPTWMEYQADTNPKSANSKFVVRPPATTGLYGHYQVVFNASSNRTYRVETSADLLNWEILEDNIRGTGGEMAVTDPRSPWNSAQTYYRVLVW